MNIQILRTKKGVTLIELLVGLVIGGIAIAGTYRLFVGQGKVYAVQGEVVEIQQSLRSAMEVLLRDIRMAGFDDEATPLVKIPDPAIVPGDNSLTVRFEHNATPFEVRYWVDEASNLKRQETSNGMVSTETILDNAGGLAIGCGVDEDGDGAMDDPNGNGVADDWIPVPAAAGLKVVALRVSLTVSPAPLNTDLRAVSPRTLVTAVTLRNVTFIR